MPEILKKNFHRRSNCVGCPNAAYMCIGEFSRAGYFCVQLLGGESCALTPDAVVHPGIRGVLKLLASFS